jgi:hypothetical protein
MIGKWSNHDGQVVKPAVEPAVKARESCGWSNLTNNRHGGGISTARGKTSGPTAVKPAVTPAVKWWSNLERHGGLANRHHGEAVRRQHGRISRS